MSPLDPGRVNPTAGDHPRDELAAYALDAVDDHERQAIEDHLAACPSCRRELAVHEEVLSGMIGDESPPAAVWERISRQAQPDRPGEVVPLTAPTPPRHFRAGQAAGRPRRRLAVALAAAAAAVVAVGLAPWALDSLTGDGSPPTTELVAPDLPVGVLQAADGTEVARVGADERGSFVEMMDPMGVLPADREYQLWSLDGPDPVSLGLLGTGADPTARVSLPEGTTKVAISDEPAGGSPAPSGLIAGTGDLAVPA